MAIISIRNAAASGALRLAIACALAAVMGVAGHASAARGRVALIVNKANALNGLSSSELRRILIGDETRWPGNGKITILLLPPGSEERRALLRILTQMSDDDFTRHWISRVFQGESAGPKTASSAASMARLVAGLPAALGMLDAEDVPAGDSGLKVLLIDGKAPADEGYPIVR